MQQKLIVEIKVNNDEIIYGENVNGIDLKLSDKVVLYIDGSYDIGTVVSEEKLLDVSKIDKNVYKIIRKVNEYDLKRIKENDLKAEEAYRTIKNICHSNELPIKVVKTLYSFDRSKLYVYYTLEKQVDLKKLVKDLAHKFRTRIVMKQIGPRDETKLLGGIGMCGYELCCKRWIKKFESISVEMARTQQLALNIPKLSGVCNRLKCCLYFEYGFYKECVEKFPKVGSKVKTKDGREGKVVSIDCIKEVVNVEFRENDETVLKALSINEIIQ